MKRCFGWGLGVSAVCLLLWMTWSGRTHPGSLGRNGHTVDRSSQEGQLEKPKASFAPASTDNQEHLRAAVSRLPLYFEANRGQTDARVRFLTRGGGYTLFLTDDGAVLSLRKVASRQTLEGGTLLEARPEHKAAKFETRVLRMKLASASAPGIFEGEASLPGYSNYFIGNDSERWATRVPHFERVRAKCVYQGVDLVYYGNQRQLEFDFVVAPATDPKVIGLRYEGADSISVGDDGGLQIDVGGCRVVQQVPIAYQFGADGTRRGVPCHYEMCADRTVRFTLGAYDTSVPLVIDPVLTYSTLLGGDALDRLGSPLAGGMVVDSSGNAYLTGVTASTNFPIEPSPGAFQTSHAGSAGETNAFVTKVSPDGTSLVFSTYLGGSNDLFGGVAEGGYGLHVDGSGNVFIGGTTSSSDFPTTSGAFAETFSGLNYTGFVAKLNSTGTALTYATFLGGDKANINAVAVDSTGNAYVTGTSGPGNPDGTSGAFQEANSGDFDVFVTKLNAAGSARVYSTYIGGTGYEECFGLALDGSNNATVVGFTDGDNYPMSNAAQSTRAGNRDAIVSKVNSDGSALIFSTYLGGSTADENGLAVACDSSGNSFVTGNARSTDFPTSNAFQDTLGTNSIDAFLTQYSSTGTVVFSTYLGGSGDDSGHSVVLDPAGYIVVAGTAGSSNFPVVDAVQSSRNGSGTDAFMSVFLDDGSALSFSSYFGGDGDDHGRSVAVLGRSLFLAGQSVNGTFTTTSGAFQETRDTGDEAFLARFDITSAPSFTSGTTAGGDVNQAFVYDLTADGALPMTFSVDASPVGLPQGLELVGNQIVGTPLVSGVFNITLNADNLDGSDSQNLELTINSAGAGDGQMNVSKASFAINWKVHNAGAGEQKDALKFAGLINPAGMPAVLPGGATVLVNLNGEDLAGGALALSDKGQASGVAGDGTKFKVKVSPKNGKLSGSFSLADLRTAFADVTDINESDEDVVAVLTVTFTGTGLDTAAPAATFPFRYSTKAGAASKGKYGFKSDLLFSGTFNSTKTAAKQQKTGGQKITAKGTIEAAGGFPVIPTGDILITIGTEPDITIPDGTLVQKGNGGDSSFTLPKDAGIAGLEKFTFSNAKKSFALTTGVLLNSGIPDAGTGGTSHDLTLTLFVPTDLGDLTFTTTVELLRKDNTSTSWKR